MRMQDPRHPALKLICLASVVLLSSCGGQVSTTSTSVQVPATADFAIQVSPTSVQIPAGGSAFVTVTLSRLNGFTADVSVSGLSFPAGVVAAGTLPSGVTTLQLPISVDPLVGASSFQGTSLRAQAGNLIHDTAIGLIVAPQLAPSNLRSDMVQAAGGRQSGGSIENHAVAREGAAAQGASNPSNAIQLRHGFTPTGVPSGQ